MGWIARRTAPLGDRRWKRPISAWTPVIGRKRPVADSQGDEAVRSDRVYRHCMQTVWQANLFVSTPLSAVLGAPDRHERDAEQSAHDPRIGPRWNGYRDAKSASSRAMRVLSDPFRPGPTVLSEMSCRPPPNPPTAEEFLQECRPVGGFPHCDIVRPQRPFQDDGISRGGPV